MRMVNQPAELEEVQCYKCKSIFKVHSMTNMHSDFIKNCALHNGCKHESDGNIYTSNPPQNKCKKCGEFYR